MKTSATFINAVMDVRVDQGMFHFTLGEMAPRSEGQPEFIQAFRCTIPAADAFGLLDYLRSKVEPIKTSVSAEVGSVQQPYRRNETNLPLHKNTSDIKKKRVIATSVSDPHTK